MISKMRTTAMSSLRTCCSVLMGGLGGQLLSVSCRPGNHPAVCSWLLTGAHRQEQHSLRPHPQQHAAAPLTFPSQMVCDSSRHLELVPVDARV